MSTSGVTIRSDEARSFIDACLVGAGASARNASIVSDHLIESSLCGMHSHGMMRLPQYLSEIEAGHLIPDRQAQLVRSERGCARLDGCLGFGQVAGVAAAQKAIECAHEFGLSLVNVTRIGHAGRIGAYTEMIAKAGLVSLAFCSGSRYGHYVAPFGARQGRLATNPISYGFPTGDGPVVADFSTSALSEGRIRALRKAHSVLPPETLRDASGNPTTDPNDLYCDPPGTIQPLGGEHFGYKGTALGVLVDLMATLLTGNRLDDQAWWGNNLALVAIATDSEFVSRADELVRYFRSAEPLDPSEPVLLPGELESISRAAANGVWVDAETWAEIRAIAQERSFAVPSEIDLDASASAGAAKEREDPNMNGGTQPLTAALGFDQARLHELMEERDLDVLLVTSKHNFRYLSGYYNRYHSRMARVAATRYLAVLGILRDGLDRAFVVLGAEEEDAVDRSCPWIAERHFTREGRSTYYQDCATAVKATLDVLREHQLTHARIGVEMPFLPAEALDSWRADLRGAVFVDASELLQELRAIKNDLELGILRETATKTAAAMEATMRSELPDTSTAEIARHFESRLVDEGLEPQWVVIAAGIEGLRQQMPALVKWRDGDVLRLDSGSSFNDYIVDICRMGVHGAATKLATRLHEDCRRINDDLLRVIRPGLTYAELRAAGEALLDGCDARQYGFHLVHGIGITTHEQPQIRTGSQRSLEPGMVMCIETEFRHPEVGDVKLEDMCAVTSTGCELLTWDPREMVVTRTAFDSTNSNEIGVA